MNILSIIGSSRENGNTEQLLSHVLNSVEHTEIRLQDYRIEPIVDQRHDEQGFSKVEDDYEQLLEQFLKTDVIIFATPVYWFGMSGQMKVFIDRWSQYMRDERFHFLEATAKQKAYVLLAGGSDPKITAMPLIQQFQYIFNFVGMSFEDYIIGNAVKPGEIKSDLLSIHKAAHWNEFFRHGQ